jgi:Ser/Thr protein kinase RdoA (MazF antagonist)
MKAEFPSSIVQSHGLDGTLVGPDWPSLTLEEVSSLLALYPDQNGPYELETVSPRPFSAASVVRANNRRVFVKRHALAVRNAEGLREEHRFMDHLRSRGARVPVVLTTRTGETTVETGEWTYEVHSTAVGTDLYFDVFSWMPFRSVEHARSAGQTLAQLQLAAEGYNAPPRKVRPLVASFSIFADCNPAIRTRQYIDQRPALQTYLNQSGWIQEALDYLSPFHAELFPLLPSLAPLWTHNDLHASNFFWSDSSLEAHPTAVIDFGLCDRSNAVHDLAHAIERNIVEWLALVNAPDRPQDVPVHFDHLWAFLEGYETMRPLSTQEALALAPMTAICHVEFALSEGDYFLAVLHSEEKARVACEGYLLGHARWWSETGQKVLNAVRSWAIQESRTKRAVTS